MFKLFTDSEWDLFQNITSDSRDTYCKSKGEKQLFSQIMQADWQDNTSSRPDFISDELMIEMFEIDDIVTTKKGKVNPQRKTDARAQRDVEGFIDEVFGEGHREDFTIIARGDTRYNPKNETFTPDDTKSHHSYKAYIQNYERICGKHLDSVKAYRENYPNKKLGFLIFDESTMYIAKDKMTSKAREIFYSLPIFDKNFMNPLIKSDVDFVLWVFNNKYIYTKEDKHGQILKLPRKMLITRDNFYVKNTKKFVSDDMVSLER